MPRNRSRNRNRTKNKGRKNKTKNFRPQKSVVPRKSKKTKSKESLAKKRTKELERAARELNLIPRNINHPDKKLVLPQSNNIGELEQNNMLPLEQLNYHDDNNMALENNNKGHNVKRMISSKMFSSKGKNGKEEMVVDILSGITKDKKSRVLRHFKVSKKGKTQYSTVLAKSDGKNIKVLESLHNGNQEKLRKFMVSKPDELKEVFNVQSDKIRGNNVVKSFHLNKGNSNKNNKSKDAKESKPKQLNQKQSNTKFSKSKVEKKTKQTFNTMRKALKNSIQSIIKPRPFDKKHKKPNKFKRSKKKKRGKKK